jgi:hypothetical protein
MAEAGAASSGDFKGPGGLGAEGRAAGTGGFSGPGGVGAASALPEGTGLGGSLRGGSFTGDPVADCGSAGLLDGGLSLTMRRIK